MKIGIIRCQQQEDRCPATTCLAFIREKKGGFAGIEEDIELIGMSSCGGCSGKSAVYRAKDMVRRGAEAIVIASCIKLGAPIGFECPNAENMIASIKATVGENIKIIDFTHYFEAVKEI